mmetsp:Transcript_26037/g.51076  ORF Transcript_26037/g.51076 Transcript_26037/m.51076 type:complete len:135 (-) Transcript_26037:239-643(-)
MGATIPSLRIARRTDEGADRGLPIFLFFILSGVFFSSLRPLHLLSVSRTTECRQSGCHRNTARERKTNLNDYKETYLTSLRDEKSSHPPTVREESWKEILRGVKRKKRQKGADGYMGEKKRLRAPEKTAVILSF